MTSISAVCLISGVWLVDAHADIKIGVTVSATGSAASIGMAQKMTIELLPTEIAGQKIDYIVLDDASDPTLAVKNIRRFTSEDNVDVVIGSTTSPASLAMVDIASQSTTPMISLAASASIVEPMDAKRVWVFKTPQNDDLMSDAIVHSMDVRHVKTVGFIGFDDAYGESWFTEFKRSAERSHIKIVASERFARNDTTVTGQALKLIAQHPDAVLIAGSGSPAALPQKTLKAHGYNGLYYQTHGVANDDFLRVCGKDCNGTLLPVGPLLISDQLPDNAPAKRGALLYRQVVARHGGESISMFGSNAWDAGLLLQHAIPIALKINQPGSAGFRAALRTALETTTDLHTSEGVVNMTPVDHSGLDGRARVMVKIVDGAWRLTED
nr:ABC transporter substrate-binding protein [Paraburkholderia flagellata]